MPYDEIRKYKSISFPGVAVVFLCHDGQGKLFLTKRSEQARDERGRWAFGGGGLKHGETVEECVRREVLEEYGASTIETSFLGYTDGIGLNDDGLKSHWVFMCFAVKVNPSEIQINEPELVQDSGWFQLTNLPQPMHSRFEAFMEKHGKKLSRVLQG